MAILCDTKTIWHQSFIILEVTTFLIIICLLFITIIKMYRNKDTYNKLELIMIVLSVLQILSFVSLTHFFNSVTFDFFVILLTDILQFTQNSIFCGILLFHSLLWNNYSFAKKIKNYFKFIIIIDILAILSGLFNKYDIQVYNQFIGLTFNSLIFLAVMGGSMDLIILLFMIYKHFDKKTNVSLELINDDSYNLNSTIQKYKTNISHIKKYYSLIIVSFLFSYLNNIFLKIFYDNGICFSNEGLSFGMMDFVFSFFFLICIRVLPHVTIFYGLILKRPEEFCKNSIFIEM